MTKVPVLMGYRALRDSTPTLDGEVQVLYSGLAVRVYQSTKEIEDCVSVVLLPKYSDSSLRFLIC